MSEVKDPAIKLFGKTISFPTKEAAAALDHNNHQQQQQSCYPTSPQNKSTSGGELTNGRLEDDIINTTEEESIEPATPSGDSETPKTPRADEETLSPKAIKMEEQSDTSESPEKTLKKPDKILPCPRCNSMDTKFCYYNNYNVNQPRHFCKNCQRYWTAGGTMRNVPVGSGRRKNKNSCSSTYHNVIVSDALPPAAQADATNGIIHLSPLKLDGNVLVFGAERPLCESMVSALNIAEGAQNYFPNGFPGVEPRIGRDHLSGPSNLNMNLTGSPWNNAWSSPASPHALSPSSFPVTFHPAKTYWNCRVPSPWNVPLLSPSPRSPNHAALSMSPTSPTLGKHCRDGSTLNSSNLGKEEPNVARSPLHPKSLKIDDSNGATKKPLPLTLEMKKDKGSISGASLFKAFGPKIDGRNHVSNTSLVLQANPAAFSRSINFHERAQ